MEDLNQGKNKPKIVTETTLNEIVEQVVIDYDEIEGCPIDLDRVRREADGYVKELRYDMKRANGQS